MKFLRNFHWFLVVLVFGGAMFFWLPKQVLAKVEIPTPTLTPTPLVVGPASLVVDPDTSRNTYSISQDLIESYFSVIDPENGGCDSPSLECLVHNIYQFVMIETYYQAKGSAGADTSSSGPGSSLPTKTNVAYQGAINGLFDLISMMYSHPLASTKTYIADVANNLNLAPPIYAQGVGFASLNPILNIWKTFRNIAYLFFVIIFLVIGFMIMFRAKVGQAAVTAQQAIPNVIISLILVTFSYAIAGFIIDLMYLSMVLIQGLFQADFGGRDAISMNFVDVVTIMFKGGTGWGNGAGFTGNGGNIVTSLLDNLSDQEGGTILSIASFIGGLTLTVVIAIALLIAAFKLFFDLLRAYATAVIYIVMAPLLLMMGAIPGQNAFIKWFKGLIGNLLPFPTVLFVLILFDQFSQNTLQSQQGGFMPPFMFGSGQGSVIAYLMGLALMLALPEITKKVRESVAGTGGIGEMIASAAGSRAKEAWSGKMPLGLNAKNIMKTAGKGAGYGAAVGVGAAAGGMLAARRGARWDVIKQGMKSGAGTAVKIPYNVGVIKSVVPDLYKEFKEQQGLEQAQGMVEWAQNKATPHSSVHGALGSVSQRIEQIKQRRYGQNQSGSGGNP